MSKIALGTAQFGMDYGINNKSGKIPKEEVFQILDFASACGIDTLDTAPAYGESQEVIGEYQVKHFNPFKIVSKLSKESFPDVQSSINDIFKKTKSNELYGLIYHHFEDFKENMDSWGILEEYKAKGKIKKIGFSLYTPDTLEYLLEKEIKADLIQLPYSIFDRRFEEYFKILRNNGIEIHVRSVFLQGLVFKRPEELDPHFFKIREKVSRLNIISKGNDISIASICINFASSNRLIDKIIVGVDTITNLKEIVDSAKYIKKIRQHFSQLCDLKEDDEKIILPFNWGKISSNVN